MLLNDYLRRKFGCKVYKLALNGGFTCPNRDGTIDTRGCIFCSAGGSGEFTPDPALSITDQIEKAKEKVAGKIKDGKYIAYFQAFTGTYLPQNQTSSINIDRLRQLYFEAINHPDIVILGDIITSPYGFKIQIVLFSFDTSTPTLINKSTSLSFYSWRPPTLIETHFRW